VAPPDNNGYERTLDLKNIGQAVAALLPFAEEAAAQTAGVDVTKSYEFKPFTPKLPNPLGESWAELGQPISPGGSDSGNASGRQG